MYPEQTQFQDPEWSDSMQYVVITPVRNEAEYIEKTLHSMVRQHVRPAEWIIVNDGSIDETAEIVARYATEHLWIKLVSREDRGARQRGKGVIEAFYAGFDSLTCQSFGFVVKLDGDLSFDSNYFEALLREFESRPKLGISGGGVYEKEYDESEWILRTSKDHVRGPTKMYRRACFEDIGGLVPALGWDGVDEWQALACGWEVRSFTELKVLHYRPTGAATGRLKSRIEQGYGAYSIGYHPLFMIARGVRNMFSRPYLAGGAVMILAYFVAFAQGREQFPDPSVLRFIRRTQLKQLTGLVFAGKPIHKY